MIRPLLTPRMLALHVVAVLATVAATLLGLWQYHVWQSGRQDQTESRVEARPVPLDAVMSSDEAFPRTAVGRPVTLSGRWVPTSSLYVDGRELEGRRGVWAVTPVAVCPEADARACARSPAVLVVRGWAASAADAPAPPDGPVRVTGWLQPDEGSGASADPDPSDDVMPELRVLDALQRVPQDLYGGYVIAESLSTSSATSGLKPVTPESLPEPSTFTSVRNLLYALEWWVFGAFAVYVWGRWCRDEVVRAGGVPSEA